MRSIWVSRSRASITAVGPVAMLLAARDFGDDRAASLDFPLIVGHQVRYNWALRACNRATKGGDCPAVEISTALGPLCVCSGFRVVAVIIDAPPLYAWLHSLLRSVWVDLCLDG